MCTSGTYIHSDWVTINRDYSYRNVTIDTKSRRRQLLASEGSEGEELLVLYSCSSHTSLATSIGDTFMLFSSEVNGFSLERET